VPYPVMFWACTAEEGTKFPVNPFDRVNLGYDGLFGSRTMFYHLPPDAGPFGNGSRLLIERLTVPVLDTNIVSEGWIEGGTVVAILIGFSWIVWKLWPGLAQLLTELKGHGAGEQGKKKQ